MKPIAIFRHSPTEGPGHFATFLERRSRPWELIAIDAGAAVPAEPRAYAGLCFMGGPMSVNDDLPWIEPVLALIRSAVAADIPVIGHCLGGQLMSKALGASVGRNPVKEIGWGEVQLADAPLAREWFGPRTGFLSFHWHGETFSLPPGTTRVLSSPACLNQAWVMGPHLAMQCHIEMTQDMIRTWCLSGADEIAAVATQPTVQQPAQMEDGIDARVAELRTVAEQVYARWAAALKDD